MQTGRAKVREQRSEWGLALAQHATHYIGLLGRDAGRFDSGAQLEAMRSIRLEIDNIQIAQDYAIAFVDPPQLAVLVRSTHWLYVIAVRDYMRGLAAAEQLVDASAKLGDPALHSLALGVRARLRHVVGEIRAALADAERAGELAGDNLEALAGAEQVLGLVHYGLHELRAAETHMQRALELYRKLGDRPRQAQMLNNLGLTSAEAGAAAALFERSLELARQLGHLWIEATVLSNLLAEALNSGSAVQARQYAEQSLAVADRLDDENTRAHVWLALAELELVAGHADEAERLLTLSGAACVRLGYALLGQQVELMRILVDTWRGRYSAAAEALLRLMQVPEWPSDPNDLILAGLWLLLRAGEVAAAQSGLELAPQLVSPGDHAPMSRLVQTELREALPAASARRAKQASAYDPVDPSLLPQLSGLLTRALRGLTNSLVEIKKSPDSEVG